MQDRIRCLQSGFPSTRSHPAEVARSLHTLHQKLWPLKLLEEILVLRLCLLAGGSIWIFNPWTSYGVFSWTQSQKVARLAEAAVILRFDVFGWNVERLRLEILPKFQWVCVLNSLWVICSVGTSFKWTDMRHIRISVRELAIAVMGVFKHLINRASFKLQNSTFLGWYSLANAHYQWLALNHYQSLTLLI